MNSNTAVQSNVAIHTNKAADWKKTVNSNKSSELIGVTTLAKRSYFAVENDPLKQNGQLEYSDPVD